MHCNVKCKNFPITIFFTKTNNEGYFNIIKIGHTFGMSQAASDKEMRE